MSSPRDEPAPAFQFYWKQWLSDDKVLAMSWAARGMHMHFICIAWQQHSPCTLPDDDEILQSWVGFPSEWEALKRQIFRAWRHDPSQNVWVQDGLLRVWQQQAAYRLSRSENAKRKGEKPAKSISRAHARHMHPSPTPTPITTTPIIPTDVDRVLQHYVTLHPRRKVVGGKLSSIVRSGLKHFSAEELIEALDGNAADPWCVSNGKHELGFVLRDADKINEYRAKAGRVSNGTSPKSPDPRDGAW